MNCFSFDVQLTNVIRVWLLFKILAEAVGQLLALIHKKHATIMRFATKIYVKLNVVNPKAQSANNAPITSRVKAHFAARKVYF